MLAGVENRRFTRTLTSDFRGKKTCSYYPYGMIIPELSAQATFPDERNFYKFSGKELQQELGYLVYSFGRRDLRRDVPVFTTPDRFAEKYPWLSPYSYAAGNPINYIDVNGDSIGSILNMIRSGLEKADQFVNKAATTILNPVFGPGTALNNLDIKMKGSTYGEWEGHADPANMGTTEIPDYAAITVSGDLVVGGGVGGDVNLGYVKGDGVFVNATGRTGSGFDVSLGIGVSWGNYKGKRGEASANDLSGVGVYQSGGGGLFSGGAWQDFGSTSGKAEIGKNWTGGSIGVSTPGYSGGFGASFTTKPLYIYKQK